MPSKKKKYNARFPAGRIKKIMQTDEEIGKVAQAVPVIISRTLELFVEQLITKTMQITTMKNARTLSPHHMKQCILSESRFDFLRDLVKSVPEVATSDDDLGSFSDNSATVQPLQRNYSRDESNKRDQANPPPSTGPNFYVETDSVTVDDKSDDSDDEEMEEGDTSQSQQKETVCQESVISCVQPPQKTESDSEDYDT